MNIRAGWCASATERRLWSGERRAQPIRSDRAGSCLKLAVNSAVAESVLEMIKDRFDHVTSQVMPGAGTVVTVTGIDQAGQRALLNLLWDTGHEIRSMSST